jgi:hypothetical protein
LRELVVEQCPVDDDIIHTLTVHLRDLRELNVNQSDAPPLTTKTLTALVTRYPALQSIGLSGQINVNDVIVDRLLSTASSLVSLDISYTGFSGLSWQNDRRQFLTLTKLNISGCSQIPNEEVLNYIRTKACPRLRDFTALAIHLPTNAELLRANIEAYQRAQREKYGLEPMQTLTARSQYSNSRSNRRSLPKQTMTTPTTTTATISMSVENNVTLSQFDNNPDSNESQPPPRKRLVVSLVKRRESQLPEDKKSNVQDEKDTLEVDNDNDNNNIEDENDYEDDDEDEDYNDDDDNDETL